MRKTLGGVTEKRVWGSLGIFALIVSGLMLPASAIAGLAGKWSGTIDVHDGSSGADVSTQVLVQIEEPQPGTISGKIGREGDADSVPIRNAKVEGSQVYFEAVSGETSGPMKFFLTLAGDAMEGEMKGAVDTADITGKVKFNRQKN